MVIFTVVEKFVIANCYNPQVAGNILASVWSVPGIGNVDSAWFRG